MSSKDEVKAAAQKVDDEVQAEDKVEAAKVEDKAEAAKVEA